MRAIVQDRYGPPGVMQLRELAEPVPGEGDVLIEMHATVATPSDVAFRTGSPFIARLFSGLLKPKTPILGDNLAGVVVAVGANVTRFKPGDRVYGSTGTLAGANAETTCVPETAALAIMPPGMSFGEAAGLADGGLTALPFLRDTGELKAGQHVLINGASGSVGTAAVQLAKLLGAEVTGVCSGRNVELVRSLGADRVIDYGVEDFTRASDAYDVIFDAVGKSSFAHCEGALKPEGIYMVGTVPTPSLLLGMLRKRGKLARFAATGLRPPADKIRDLALLSAYFHAGKLRTVIDRRYPLEQIAVAHAYVETGHKVGSVVIDIEARADA
ncbi:NAD(P)-dependent alcohol dehydrogenase [Devosia sp. CN2-171]|uniref:NAD(P)-dependent alcohol dehydrogenase n=1 Tax=Devosia sp. CN2-171 TaxID=3400909 RepID=UPI003BF7C57B